MTDRSHRARLVHAVTRVAAFAADTSVMGVAYLAAFALRLDFSEPVFGWYAVGTSFITVWAVQNLSLLCCGCFRLPWRRTGLVSLPRFAIAMAISGATLVFARFLLPSPAYAGMRPPYSITLVNMILAGLGLLSIRVLWRIYVRSKAESECVMEEDARVDMLATVSLVSGKTVMVTGAGGTIGAEVVRQVVLAGAGCVLLVERSESALYEIDREVRRLGVGTRCIPLLKDVQNGMAMAQVFKTCRPQIVIHSAAYKHVPMVEENPVEGLCNNTLATCSLARMAAENGTERFILISTDKAQDPLGMMGATKRLAELALAGMAGGGMVCASVRFGNIYGASGSVVPLFTEQIAAKRPVTITHPGMRRCFIPVREAVSLVLKAASIAKGGEVFVLESGKDVNILELAEKMIKRAGWRPYVDIPVVFTGIRPGEKLVDMQNLDDGCCIRTSCERIYVCRDTPVVPDVAARIEMLLKDDHEAPDFVRLTLALVKELEGKNK